MKRALEINKWPGLSTESIQSEPFNRTGSLGNTRCSHRTKDRVGQNGGDVLIQKLKDEARIELQQNAVEQFTSSERVRNFQCLKLKHLTHTPESSALFLANNSVSSRWYIMSKLISWKWENDAGACHSGTAVWVSQPLPQAKSKAICNCNYLHMETMLWNSYIIEGSRLQFKI